MNISALLACLFFYSALYLFYFFFAKQQNPLFILAAIILMVLTVFIIPYPHERRRQGFDSTLRFGEYFGGVLKSMLTLNEAIIDVKEG